MFLAKLLATPGRSEKARCLRISDPPLSLFLFFYLYEVRHK